MLRASYAVFGCSCLVAVKAGRQRYDLIRQAELVDYAFCLNYCT